MIGSGTGDKPVNLGTVLFTMVEPRKGHEVEYNRWYERDHFYAGCMIGEFNFAGNRYVATKDLKALRYPVESPVTPSPEIGSYLALYWILRGNHDDWNRWAVDQVNWLHANGRMFAERDHIHTVLYDYLYDVNRDAERADGGVPVELALDHQYAGVGVTLLEATGDRDEAIEWLRGVLPSTIKGSGIGQAVVLTPKPLLDDAPADVPRDPATAVRILILWFLDQEPTSTWGPIEGFGKVVADGGKANLVWASPFKTTVKGTDQYTDQLW